MEFCIPVVSVKCVTLISSNNVSQFSEPGLFLQNISVALVIARQSQQWKKWVNQEYLL